MREIQYNDAVSTVEGGRKSWREHRERGVPGSPAPPFSSSCYKPPQAACTGKEVLITFPKC